MNYEILIRAGILRKRSINASRVNSLVSFAEKNVKMAKTIPLNEDSSTIIFREIYESVRQLGEASWWLKGYEPTNHEISLDGLQNWDIKEKVKLNFLPRFKKIRNDANYEGMNVSLSQAKEIIDFWDSCCKEIVQLILNIILTK